MQNITRICECCKEPYRMDSNPICPSCNEKWELESRWQENEEAWREQENEMLQARGFIIEDDYEDDYYVCQHCGDALPVEAVGLFDICECCEYTLEHPQDEIEYDSFAQVHDPNYPF